MTLLDLVRAIEARHYPEGFSTSVLKEIHDTYLRQPNQDPTTMILRIATRSELDTAHLHTTYPLVHEFDTIRDMPDDVTRTIGVELAIGDQFMPVHSDAIIVVDDIEDTTITVTRHLGGKEITTTMEYDVAQDLVRSYRWKRI